jgi:chorismate synthase
MSEIGTLFRVALFGESHGPGVGALVLGCPPGIRFDQAFIQTQLDRRRPGQSAVTTQRKEADTLQVLSGVHNGHTTGAPVCLFASNKDMDSSKYEKNVPRPGHADLSAELKFFGFADRRGGGHFGGRLTFGLTAAGALARLGLRRFGAQTQAFTDEIGGITMASTPDWDAVDRAVDGNDVRCPDAKVGAKMRDLILKTRNKGDSVGGVVRCRIRGLPPGVGGYHAESFESELSKLLFGIPAVKGVEFGEGFALSRMKGSQSNDPIGLVDGRPRTLSHKQGGLVGGITDGNIVEFRVAFKPTSSLILEQDTVDLETLKPTKLGTQGRHDPCIVPRAVVVVENAAAIVAFDLLLRRLGETTYEEGPV